MTIRRSPGCKCTCGPAGVAIPGCGCGSIPQVLTLSAASACQFVAATLRWVPTAGTGLETVIPTSNAFLSDATYTDANGPHRYYFTCVTSVYTLARAYTSLFGGGPSLENPRYQWGQGSPNTCTPFLLTAGAAINGGNCPTNSLTVSP